MPTTLQRIAIFGLGLVVAGSLTGCGGGSTETPAGNSTPAVGVPSPTGHQISTPMPGVTASLVSAPAAIAGSVVAAGETIDQMSITAPDGTTTEGLSGSYRLRITDALRTSATGTILVP